MILSLASCLLHLHLTVIMSPRQASHLLLLFVLTGLHIDPSYTLLTPSQERSALATLKFWMGTLRTEC